MAYNLLIMNYYFVVLGMTEQIIYVRDSVIENVRACYFFSSFYQKNYSVLGLRDIFRIIVLVGEGRG